ncbi:MAG: zinc finger-like domain-containing protein [Bacteroidota bacterium]
MISTNLLEKYFVKSPPTYRYYGEAVEIANELRAHSKKEFPERLLDTARPNEEPKFKEYRREVYEPKTKAVFDRVITNLCKIERAEDWSIKYEDAENSELADYCEKNFPFFDSITNWFFTIGIQRMVDDPNGVVLVIPDNLDAPDNIKRNPCLLFFASENVLEYQEGKMCVLLDKEKSLVSVGKDQKAEGNIFHFVDVDTYYKAVQYGEKEKYIFEVTSYLHNIGFMPAIKLGGKVKEYEDGYSLYESFISAAVPDWNEAVRRYSDHQVNMVRHLHPKEWGMRDTECKSCKGTGKTQERNHKSVLVQTSCNSCQGTGHIHYESPFGKIMVNPGAKRGMNNDAPVVTPPGGYIDRPIDSISFLKTEVADCLKDGLRALNMEFLMQEPEVNSGVAKSYDRQELNTFFYSVSRHSTENVIDPVYYFVNGWRFAYIPLPKREAQLPKINTPTKFDLTNSAIASSRLDVAIKGGFDKALINRLQTEYARKEFGEDCEEAMVIQVTYELDPLPNLTVDEKMTVLSSNGCSQEDFVLSVKISGFINRAMEENEDFLTLDYKAQMDILKGYIKEMNDAKAAALLELVDANGMPLSNAAEPNKLAQTAAALDATVKMGIAVAEGKYPLDAAVALLSDRFSIPEDKARRQLGNPALAPINPALNVAVSK